MYVTSIYDFSGLCEACANEDLDCSLVLISE